MSAVGAITGIVGLGVTLGALGLAFDFVDKQVGRTQQSVGRNQQRRRAPTDDIFDLGLTQRKSGSKKFRNDFGDDFNIFAI